MNKMVRKLKKSNKALRFLYYLVMIFYVVGLVLFIKSLLSLTGIETMIRTIASPMNEFNNATVISYFTFTGVGRIELSFELCDISNDSAL